MWRIQFLECLEGVLVNIFMIILVNLIFFRNCLSNLLYIFYIFFPPRTLLGINHLFNFDVFSIVWINFYMIPFIGLVNILDGITVSLGVFLDGYIL